MNIEESKSLLGWVSLNKLYIDTHNECDYHNIHTAIETLLTAYEKEKEKEKNLLIQLKDSEKELLEVCEKLRNSVSKDKIKAKIEELDIQIQCCEYADDDTEEYKKDIEKEKRRLLRDKKVLQSLLEKE